MRRADFAMLRGSFVVVCLLLSLGACKDDRRWQTVAPAEAGFAVRMPVEPRMAVQKAHTAWGPVQVRFFEAETDDGAVVYSVTYTDYPFEELEAGQAQTLLREAQQATARDIAGTVSSEEATTHRGHPARRTRLRASSGVEYHVLVVLAGARLYQVFTASRPGKLDASERAKFFDSFELMKKSENGR
ncbi:MAG: hypothetical protein ACOC1F_09060 [Myxococcota bacterium]